MTYPEVIDEINAYRQRCKAKLRDYECLRAEMDYQLAQLIGVMFHEPKKYPKSLQSAYPGLFKGTSGGWRESKAQWQKYAAEFNRQREARH